VEGGEVGARPTRAVDGKGAEWLDQGCHPCYGKDMSKVTSKLQVTIPKLVAERYGIHPGDEINWEPAGEVIRVVPPRPPSPRLRLEERLRLFDEATERQRVRDAGRPLVGKVTERGWRREDLYTRGSSR